MGTGLNTALLTELNALPEGILDATTKQLKQILSGPTLIHLPGLRQQPLFISILLHGNETTGLLAIQALLKEYQHKPFPRALSIFFGNIEAASQGVRKLSGQPDYNRIWPGTELPTCPETVMTQQILALMAKRNVFASIDIHNNTGLNPHYACITRLDNRSQQLAMLFSRLVVYFIRPRGVQSAAFAPICPAVTLECGKPEQAYGVQHALEFLHSCLFCQSISDNPITTDAINLIHSVARVEIPESITFSFKKADVDLKLNADLDHMNFTEVPAGTEFGRVRPGINLPLRVRNEAGDDVSESYFQLNGNRLICSRPVIPSMLTLDERVIRQDCFCYLMENFN